MKEFSKWTIEEVEETFQVTQIAAVPALTAWSNAANTISPEQEALLSALREKLFAYVHDWNEEELKLKFIGLLIALVDYDSADYHVFFERQLTVRINQERLSGVIDCVIARGKRSPKRPLFCLQEYKPEKHASNDPLGQVLVAMIAAQYLNQDEQPIYGAYVMGRNWYFVVLDHKDYAVSMEYDATKETDLRQIVRMLKQIKTLIEAQLSA